MKKLVIAAAFACIIPTCSYAWDSNGRPDIVAEAARYIGSRNPTGFRGPWCKAFVNMVSRRTGYYANPSLRARDTHAMGVRITNPVPGAFRVTRGHVSVVARVEGVRVVAVSGNNGRGRVGWSHYSARGAAYYLPVQTAAYSGDGAARYRRGHHERRDDVPGYRMAEGWGSV